jgi:hypothetical protein
MKKPSAGAVIVTLVVITLIGLVIGYFTSPTFKKWVNTNIFNKKKPEP